MVLVFVFVPVVVLVVGFEVGVCWLLCCAFGNLCWCCCVCVWC